jgi:hypothetical protein
MPVLLKTRNHMLIHKFWRRLTTTRYARTLEAELAIERAVITRLDVVIARQGVEIDQQGAEISQQGIEVARQVAEIDQQGIEVARQVAEIDQQGIEITRLRAENRALLNSILGIAGIPPLPATEADLATLQVSPLSGTGPAGRRDRENDACAPSLSRDPSDLGSGLPSHQMNARGQAEACPTEDSPPTRARNHSGPHANQTPHVAAPTRRRSWPQIHRLLEFESVQKEKPAADPLPPAHQ